MPGLTTVFYVWSCKLLVQIHDVSQAIMHISSVDYTKKIFSVLATFAHGRLESIVQSIVTY